MSASDTNPESLDEESQTLQSQRIWKAARKTDLDFDSQRLRNRLRAKMFGVDAAPVKIGRFAVLETVGSGGMGVVYAAYDEELDRRVAVKLLHTSREEDASIGKGRLHREAQALAKLSHPNVVQIYEVSTFNDRVFLAMEFLSGADLRSWLIDEPRPWQEVLRHFIAAGEGLAAAHREGIIHRDFKPANILFGGDGRVRVVDFGLARASEHARAPQVRPTEETKAQAFAVELTQTGEVMGTPAYMSPEQARYEAIDARSDQFSFCVSLYEALFGRRPHDGTSTAEVLVAVAGGEVEPPPRATKVPARIVRAVMRGLSTDPADRFPTMEALLSELSLEDRGRWRLLGGGGILVAAATAGTLMFIGNPECPSFAGDLRDAWDAERQAEVRSVFARAGVPNGAEIAERTSQRLDAYASEWLAARRDACEAHRLRHEQSAQLHDQRVQCLLERKVELGTLTSVFAEADPRVVENAPRAVAELSTLAECGDLARMSAAAEAPASQELRAAQAEVRAQYKAGLYEQALAGAESTVARAREEGAHRVEAESTLQQGLIQERRRAYQLAADAAEEAIDLAEVAGADDVAARAWSRLARYRAKLGTTPLADLAVRRARAKVRRLGDEPEFVLEVRESHAQAAWRAQRYEEAVEEQTRAVQYHREHHGADDPRTADAERLLANMLSDHGRHDEAQAHYANAHRVLEQAYGPGHPMLGDVFVDLAIDHLKAGKLDEARVGFLEAEGLFVVAHGPDAPALLQVYKALAQIALSRGALDEAARYAERLFALSKGPEASPTDRPDALALKGAVASALGHTEQAMEVYAEFLRITESDELARLYPLERVATRINLAGRLQDLGRFDEADAELSRAMVELDRTEVEPDTEARRATLRGSVWLSSARLLEARGEPSTEACEQGLRAWSDELAIDPEGRYMQAKLRWTLARQLQATDPARALQLAGAARLQLDDETRAEVDAWLKTRPDASGS